MATTRTTGRVPPGYENTAGTTVPISDTAVEFGFSDGYNFDTADFTAATLTLTDQVNNNGAVPWQQTFTDPAFSGVITKVSDTFDNGGVTASVSGDTITLNWAGTGVTNVTYSAVFDVGSALQVPEPSTWALLVLGAGVLGLSLRRRAIRIIDRFFVTRQRPKAQRIHHRHRSRAHRKNVPQNPAHARSRALVGLDVAGMVVALDLERARPAIAHIDDPGVFSRPLQHRPGPLVRAPLVGRRFRCTRLLL